jgi:predicted metal-dependent hydrolase
MGGNPTKRLLIIVENHGFVPANRESLISYLRQTFNNLFIVNDVRVASDHIEIDVFCDDLKNLGKVNEFSKLMFFRDLSRFEFNGDIFKKVIELFNSERFWEVHELLEILWRKAEGKEKSLLHGLILTAAALVHIQRNNITRAVSIFKRALYEMKDFSGTYNGINVSLIKMKILDMIEKNEFKPFKIE